MRAKELQVVFQPTGRKVYVLPGTSIMEAAGRAGIILQSPCGGNGICGKCRVRVVGGDGDGWCLACQERVEGDMVVEIPAESLFEATENILTDDSGRQVELRPVVRKKYFELVPPASGDDISDVARLQGGIGEVVVPFFILGKLPGFLRENGWRGTAVMAGDRLICLEAGDTTGTAYGVAIDLGTTTIVATLFDLVAGRDVAQVPRMNPQVSYGDDVIARIGRIRDEPGAQGELQGAVITAINELLRQLAGDAGIDLKSIYEITVAGNSTMQQILCGVDSAALGEVPFVQVFDRALQISASKIGIDTGSCTELYVFPQIGGFVGGDTVAGILAAGMDRAEKPTLLVDIGTNGEIVLAHNGKLEATSTAAGPAFEGARIVQGMRAASGAIEKVVLDGDVRLNVIGNSRPAGLCGTALIDVVAELLRCGLIDETGHILSAEEAGDRATAALRQRLVEMDGQVNFMLATAEESASGEPIFLWQKDVRELQLASGAIRAGINILLRRAGLEAADLDAVLLAGAFGNFIRRSNARRIGLLPSVPTNKIRFIGNAASLGAKLALLARDERERAAEIGRRTEHVDLSLDAEFQMEFGMAMMFPAEE